MAINEVRCDRCPIIDYCSSYKELMEKRGYSLSPNPEDNAYVSPDNCPLMRLLSLISEGK